IQKAALLSGKNRKPGKTDRFRHQVTVYSGRDGWQEGYGSGEPEAGEAGWRAVRRYAALCGRCRRKFKSDDTGERNARRSVNLLITPKKKIPAGAVICGWSGASIML